VRKSGSGDLLMPAGIILMLAGAVDGQGLAMAADAIGLHAPAGVIAITAGLVILLGLVAFLWGLDRVRKTIAGGSGGRSAP